MEEHRKKILEQGWSSTCRSDQPMAITMHELKAEFEETVRVEFGTTLFMADKSRKYYLV